ncbi:hypothetical protein RFI_31104 [Reticulomyxa filosa]|uniref:Cytochrome P450 n=1 Tax=Reticulomyxa filosa TaxID=46433 RepID=X6LXD7_RETFI|nr:hypothetical protein RFI_31104 [Reticulomyxa filosa]|eukprot:ETO06289.1 hypothetical protein RFI_31104 [Reticulomyxa filosa]
MKYILKNVNTVFWKEYCLEVEIMLNLLLFAFCIGLSVAAEFWGGYGAWTLVISLTTLGLWLTAAKRHDNIVTIEPFQPYFGHLNEFRRFYSGSMYDDCAKWLAKYEKHRVIAFSLPLRTYVSILDPAYIELIWTAEFESAEKSDFFNEKYEPLFGNGIFNADGKIWRKHRKIASQIFTMRSLKGHMFECFINTTKDFMEKISEMTNKGNKAIDISDMFGRLTLEAFTFMAFGAEVPCIRKAPEVLEFPKAFDAAFVICSRRWLNPLFKLESWLNIGKEKELKQHVKVVNKFVSDVIAQRKDMKYRDELAKRYDLISSFLQDKEHQMTEKELRDITINFITAGRDTTASLLTWTCYELAMHPDICDKVRKEVVSLCGDDADDFMSFDQVTKMTYLEAVLFETLRLHPSVPVLLRFATRDIHLPGGEIIRKGEGVVINAYALARLDKFWKDPLKFDPTRFLDQTYSPAQYPYFNLPPRLCLGKHVAIMETKIAIAKLAMKYNFKLKEGQSFVPTFSATMQLKEGMKMHFIPRT